MLPSMYADVRCYYIDVAITRYRPDMQGGEISGALVRNQ